MATDTLMHYGVRGMKWGVIRNKIQKSVTRKPGAHLEKERLAATTDGGEKTKVTVATATSKRPLMQRSTESLSTPELRELINRMELEKRYLDLMKEPTKQSAGKEFVKTVIKDSALNISKQAATYALGKAVNKAFKAEIVNPKKGQKDK
jgi:hypothetical protein